LEDPKFKELLRKKWREEKQAYRAKKKLTSLDTKGESANAGK
jgi:hypothetical protein